MDTPFLTIAEAAKKTGRSASTIRRLIHGIVEREKHPDRAAVLPPHAKACALRKKGVIFAWKIRVDILDREFQGAPAEEKKSMDSSSPTVLALLQKELELKNQQIEKQWEVIHALNERLREGNILMGTLQKRLAPPESPAPAAAVVEMTAAKPSAKPSMEAIKKASKRGLFRWLRRRARTVA